MISKIHDQQKGDPYVQCTYITSKIHVQHWIHVQQIHLSALENNADKNASKIEKSSDFFLRHPVFCWFAGALYTVLLVMYFAGHVCYWSCMCIVSATLKDLQPGGG
jgi:hypothetical protein